MVEQVQPEVPVIEPAAPSESDSSAPSELGIDDLEVADVADPSPSGFEPFSDVPGEALMVHRVSGVVQTTMELVAVG